MRMLPENHAFFIRGDDGQEYGPAGLNELHDWVRENRAGLGTEVRIDEPNAPWRPWQDYPELIALLAQVHVTSPVPGQPGLVIAPVIRRMAAFVLDLFLVALIWFPIFVTIALVYMPDWCVQYTLIAFQSPLDSSNLPLYGEAVGQLILDVLLALYFSGFLAAHGQTPGKAILRLRVVDQNGEKPALVKSVLRALALIFSMTFLFLPLTYAFFNPQRRALHDYIAGTYVVEA
jgi:uncharacterized RDD family membrane protein YckC